MRTRPELSPFDFLANICNLVLELIFNCWKTVVYNMVTNYFSIIQYVINVKDEVFKKYMLKSFKVTA